MQKIEGALCGISFMTQKFKALTAENWLEPDPTSVIFFEASRIPMEALAQCQAKI